MEKANQKHFPPYALDLVNQCLWQGSQAVKIRPKAFAVLKYLVDHPSRLVTKEELLGVVWPDTFVGDAVLKVTIRELREALHDDPKSPRFIETAHRRGYRFIAAMDDEHRSLQRNDSSTDPARQTALLNSGVVGRDAALTRLHSLLGKVLGQQRQLVFVTGEAGIGKTALVDGFVETIRYNTEIRIARGQCLAQYGTTEPYLPVLEAIGQLCRQEQAVTVLLRNHAPMWLLQMPFLVSPSERESLIREVAGATRERMLREMANAIDALANEKPVVLILEDLHWSDYSTLDLISYLANQRESARLMLICTYRPVDLTLNRHPLKAVKQELLAKQRCEEVTLDYLGEAAIADYLSRRFHDYELVRTLTPLIHEQTEGHPLFMINAVDFLIEERLITATADRWELSTDVASMKVGVPDNIKEMIATQIDRVGPDKLRILEAASVAGVEFSTLAVCAGLDEDPDRVEELCRELAVRHQYLNDYGLHELPNGRVVARYQFAHVLYQNVLYESLPPSRRIQLHKRIAERGEEVYGERSIEIAGELAMHFERGRDYRRATKYLQEAANTAIRCYAYREAVGLARRAIDLCTKLPKSLDRTRQELSLYLSLGVPLIATEGYATDSVGKAYQRARELYEEIGDAPEIAEVLWGLWTFHMLRAELGTALQIAQEFLRLSERLPDSSLALRGHWALEITCMHLGEFDRALDHYEKALAAYVPEQHRDDSFFYALNPGVAMPCFAAWSLWFRGKPDQALNQINEALSLAAELSEPHGLAHAHFFASGLYQLRNEKRSAQRHAEKVIELAGEHGLVMYEAMARVVAGWATADSDPAKSVEQIQAGLKTLESTSTVLVRPHFLALFGETLVKDGQLNLALGAVEEAIALVGRNDESYYKAELFRLKGELLLKQASGRDLSNSEISSSIANERNASVLEQCEESFLHAIDIAKSQKAESWVLRARLALASFFQCCGRDKEASELNDPV